MREAELQPNFNGPTKSSVKGTRKCIISSLIKKEAMPGDTYCVETPFLKENECIIPNTMNLSFQFSNVNTKSWFKNNLARQLCNQLCVSVDGTTVYDCTGESIYRTYEDLWKSDKERKNMTEYGVANENTRKLLSKDDSAVNNAEDIRRSKDNNRQKIELGQVLSGHGPYATHNMARFQYEIRLPQADEIMTAQSGQKVEEYRLTDIDLEFETIGCTDLTKRVRNEYTVGRSLAFESVHMSSKQEWKKDSTSESISINIPRNSVKGVVLLCTRKGSDDSEEFVNPQAEKVSVTVEGAPNSVYSKGLLRNELYREAKRFFGTQNDTDNVSGDNFGKDKHAIVVDFRPVNDKTVFGSGIKIAGMQSGILLEIEKGTTTEDLTCYVFVVADALVDIVEGKFQKVSV